MGDPQSCSSSGGHACFQTGKVMGLELFPKAQAGEPLCLQGTFPRACPALAPAGPEAKAPWALLSGSCFSEDFCGLAQHMCVLGAFYTHLHKPLPLQCCWGQLLAAAATVSPSGLTPGLSSDLPAGLPRAWNPTRASWAQGQQSLLWASRWEKKREREKQAGARYPAAEGPAQAAACSFPPLVAELTNRSATRSPGQGPVGPPQADFPAGHSTSLRLRTGPEGSREAPQPSLHP